MNIKIANFRCFEKLEIDLKDNYTVLLGINGAGKSSVLDAISIGLGSYLSGYDKISTNSIHTDDAHYRTYQIVISNRYR
ncbi:MAG: AAA family ATPase [Candidatus Galacturonibacter soehngenii]|uniref:AAA family ATPase n=1 Tax=Candidatus Galacturonatibacter soehngenii TaxID=2307010 RepID=A0A7V7QN19_9FIRM|nr:AAA family ATPase [Candidatus Galacturonibacter soehngenii]MBA4688854.1 AAA family ATPase [Candidatus Galacturonibacter soehngenii]